MTDKYLLLDNVSIHHSKLFKSYILTNNLNIIYNVPYSPEYNPIELMFSKLKKNVKDFYDNFTLNKLKFNINNSFMSITSTDLFHYFKHSFFLLMKYT